MNTADTHAYAKWLLETRGDKAELHAAEEQKRCETGGDAQEIENWRKIRAAIREMRGARES